MDTKLKSRSIYIIAWLFCIYMLGLSLVGVADIAKNQNYLRNTNYFESYQFKGEIDKFYNMVKSYHIDFKDYAEKTDEERVTEEDMEARSGEYESMVQQKTDEIQYKYAAYMDGARSAGKHDEVRKIMVEQENELKEAKVQLNEELRKRVLAEKNNQFNELKKSLAIRSSFIKYYIRDGEKGEVYTNLKDIQDIDTYVKGKNKYILKLPQDRLGEDPYYSWMSSDFDTLGWSGYFIVPEKVERTSQQYADYQYYKAMGERVLKEIYLSIAALILGVLSLLYLRKKALHEVPIIMKMTETLKKIPLDFRIAGFILYSFVMMAYIPNMNFFYFPIGVEHFVRLTFVSLYIVYFMIQGKEAYELLNNKQELQKQWEQSYVYQLRNLAKESFANKNVMFKVVVLFMLTGLLGAFGFLALYGLMRGTLEFVIVPFIYALLYLVTVIPYILRRIGLLNKIIKGTEEIVAGNLNYSIEAKGRGNLVHLAQNINEMKGSFKASLEGQVKSERLKTELITNVSHDLKTPLTSIINYVDLLKREELPREEMQNYIGILDRKAQRLKVLIDDLFEASKVTSGAVELNIEKVDVVALLNQALAEYDEKIKQSSLTFKLNIEKQKIYAQLDGKKTWRVFENLISNALKYSQPQTRVYISIAEEDHKVIFTIKNIASYEMDFDVEEIFERFKRGDKSRNTEGSGLGLAIAKSIVELQGGKLNIEVDGDLFKAIVEFNK